MITSKNITLMVGLLLGLTALTGCNMDNVFEHMKWYSPSDFSIYGDYQKCRESLDRVTRIFNENALKVSSRLGLQDGCERSFPGNGWRFFVVTPAVSHKTFHPYDYDRTPDPVPTPEQELNMCNDKLKKYLAFLLQSDGEYEHIILTVTPCDFSAHTREIVDDGFVSWVLRKRNKAIL